MSTRIGFIGTALGHPVMFTKVMRMMNGVEPAGFWDPGDDTDRMATLSKQLNLPVYDSLEAMLDDVDGVIVTTRTHRHGEFAIRAMERKLPVFIDKPMATSFVEARRIVDYATEHGAALMSCSIRRFAPAFADMAQACRNGDIGLPLTATRFEPHGITPGGWQDLVETSGGMLFNFGIHCVDSLQAMLGPRAVSVYAIGDKRVQPEAATYDTITVTTRFESGAVGYAEVLGSMDANETMATAPSARVFATSNSLEARITENLTTQYRGDRYGVSSHYALLGGGYDTMRLFVEMVRGGEPPIPYPEMLEVVGILDAARQSAAGGAVVTMDAVRPQLAALV